jgi:hypothetical protein
MTLVPFRLQAEFSGGFTLRRGGEKWTRMFLTVKAALLYVRGLPGVKGTSLTVLDRHGSPMMVFAV